MPDGQRPARSPEAGELVQLTSLRGVACMVVLFGHAIQIFHYAPPGGGAMAQALYTVVTAAVNAESAVRLFFVLSGCVLALSLRRMVRLEPAAVIGFYVKRVFRIYPLLLLSLPLAWCSIVATREGAVEGVFADWLVRNVGSPAGLREVLLSATGIYTRLNGPMWSLRVELIWSAAFPFLYVLLRRARFRWFALALLGLLALAPLPHEWGVGFGFSFALGTLIPFGAPRRVPGPVIVLAVLLMAYDRFLLLPLGVAERFLDVGESLAAFLLVLDLFGSGRQPRLLTRPGLILIGEWSFGIYLLHLPIMLLLFAAVRRLWGEGVVLGSPYAAPLLLGTATAIVTIALAAPCHRWWEKPFQRLGRAVARRVGGPALPTAAPLPAVGPGPA